MALIIPPGYLQAVYELSLEGDSEQMVVTLGHEIDSASGATAEQAPDDLMAALGSTWMTPRASGPYSLTGVTVYAGNDGPPLVYTSTLSPIPAGSPSVTVLPPNSAYLLRKRTDLAGKRGRGRLYWPGVPEGYVDNVGNLSTASRDADQAAWDDFYEYLTANIGARLYPPVVLHRSEGAGEEPPPTPITAFVLDGKIATQRRRLRP